MPTDDLNFDNLMADLDAAVIARAGRRVDAKPARDPDVVRIEREVEANFYRAQWHDQQRAKGGAR